MDNSLNDSSKENNDTTNFLCQSTIKLQETLMESVENILNRVTDDAFIKIYKDSYKYFEKKNDIEIPPLSGSSAEARKYREKFNAFVMQSTKETINETLLDSVDSKLLELEELKQENSDKSFQWRPPGNAYQHMIPFDTVSKLEEKKQIECCIEKEREDIELLKTRLIQKRLKAKELYEIMKSSLKNIEDAVVVSKAEAQKSENITDKENI